MDNKTDEIIWFHNYGTIQIIRRKEFGTAYMIHCDSV